MGCGPSPAGVTVLGCSYKNLLGLGFFPTLGPAA